MQHKFEWNILLINKNMCSNNSFKQSRTATIAQVQTVHHNAEEREQTLAKNCKKGKGQARTYKSSIVPWKRSRDHA